MQISTKLVHLHTDVHIEFYTIQKQQVWHVPDQVMKIAGFKWFW